MWPVSCRVCCKASIVNEAHLVGLNRACESALLLNGAMNLWIIGYGNVYRQDDGVGRYIADQLMPRYRAVSGVHILSLHQLGPELAEDLQNANAIVFVDAGVQSSGRIWRRIRPIQHMSGVSHSLTPIALLGLIQVLYSITPPAWIVSIQANDFDFAEGMSRTAEANAMQAITEISGFIDWRLQDALQAGAAEQSDRCASRKSGDKRIVTSKQ